MMASESNQQESKASTTRILVVDDHAIVRHGLQLLVEREEDLEVVGEAANRTEALRAMEALRPDIVVLDLSLEDESGLELIKDFSAQFPETRVVVLSMLNEMIYAGRALKAGASGYVMKQEKPETLITAIRTVLKGEIHMSRAVSQQMAHKMVRGDEATSPSPIDLLTDRELQVFELIGNGSGVTEIAETLNLSGKTVETYRERIKQKLGLPGARELTHMAVEWMRKEHG